MKLKLCFIVLAIFSLKSFAEMGEMMEGHGHHSDGDMSYRGASLFGDFRFRYINGGDEVTAEEGSDSAMKRSGNTMNYRFRAGVKYRLSEKLSFKGRLRTFSSGIGRSGQGSYYEMGRDFAPASMGLDLAYVKAKFMGLKIKLGKQPLPFWKQSEVYWDDDVTPEGLTLSKSFGITDSMKIRPVFGYYVVREAGFIDENDNDTKDNADATMMAFQLKGKWSMMNSKLKWGIGMLNISNFHSDSGESLYTVGKEGRDYSLNLVVSAHWMSMLGSLPWGVGFDYISNGGEVADEDESDEALKSETSAMAFNVKLGKLKEQGDWKARVTYAQVGKHAVHPRFSQNHWTMSSDLLSNYAGFGLDLMYACTKESNVAFRWYNIAAKKGDSGDAAKDRKSSLMMVDYSVSFM